MAEGVAIAGCEETLVEGAGDGAVDARPNILAPAEGGGGDGFVFLARELSWLSLSSTDALRFGEVGFSPPKMFCEVGWGPPKMLWEDLVFFGGESSSLSLSSADALRFGEVGFNLPKMFCEAGTGFLTDPLNIEEPTEELGGPALKEGGGGPGLVPKSAASAGERVAVPTRVENSED